MQKNVTPNGFKGLFLKTCITVLVMSVSFGIAFAQKDVARKAAAEAKQSAKVTAVDPKAKSDVPMTTNRTVVPANAKAFSSALKMQSPTTSSFGDAVATFTGALGAGDCTIPFRLFRDGIQSTCGVPRTFPGTAGGPAHYVDYYSVTNTTAAPACLTMSLTTTDLTNANLMTATYLGSFDPANMGTNWVADPGLSTGIPASAPLVQAYQLAPGATAVILVFSANPNTDIFGTAANYTLEVDGLPTSCVAPTTPGSITGNTNLCAGASTTLTVACGAALNSASNWQWYSGSCGGTPVGSGRSITVSPATTTTYYVRGEGGCVTPGACASITVNVSGPSTAAVLSQATLPPVPTVVMTEGMDGTVAPPAGWTFRNNSSPLGATNWTMSAAIAPPLPFAPQSGAGYISANFNNTGSVGTISNWLFPPTPTTLRNGDKLKFWTRNPSNTWPDRLQVRMNTTNTGTNVGTTATDVGDFSTLLLDINPTYTPTGYPTAWTEYTVTLSGLPAAGIPGRLAFRYFVEDGGADGSRSNFIGIDNVTYTAMLPGPTPTTCTGSTANLVVNITGGQSPYTVTITPTSPAGPAIVVPNYVSGTPIPVTPGVTTTYALTSVVSAAGCTGTGNSGTPTITVTATTVPGLIIVDDPTGPLCAGDPKLLTVTTAPTLNTFSTGAILVNIPGSGTGSSAAPGPASIYPLNLNVSGLATSGVSVKSVTFRGLSHTYMSDVNMLLQSPTGQNVVIMADAGQGGDWVNHTLTFDDAAPNFLTNTTATNPPASGTTWKPSNLNDFLFPASDPDVWPAPGPGTFGSQLPLSTFTGNFNGTWKMFITDDGGGDIGTLTGGYDIVFSTPSAVPTGWTFVWSPSTGLSSTTTNPVAASPMQTTTYQVLGTAPNGCQTTAQITITVNQLPAVTTQPSNTTVCAGSTATFTAAGSGAGFTYQWQVSTNGGATWTNLSNAAPYSGVTTGTLTVNPVTNAMNGYRYRLAVSGTCPPVANSNGAVLTVIPLPTVTINPAGPVCGGVAGTSATQLTASGANTYTWSPLAGLFTNAAGTTPYTGGNTATVYAAPGANTVYTVTGTNTTTGCVGTATVTVNYTPTPPVVLPASATICRGGIQQLQIQPNAVTVSSGTVNVGIPDNDLTGATSTINVTTVPGAAVVSNASVNLNMTHAWTGDMVIVLKAPNNKILNLAYYLTATGGAGATTGFINTNISSTGTTPLAAGSGSFTGTFAADLVTPATQVPGFPSGPNGMLPNTALWSDLYSTPNGVWTLGMYDGGASDVGTLQSWSITLSYGAAPLGVWSPATGLYTDPAGTVPYIAGTAVQTVYASPTTSTNYSVTVANGSCISPARIVPVTVNVPVTITTQPVNATVCTNKTTTFTVAATGTAPTYQWQVSTDNGNTWANVTNGGVYSGATTNTLTISNPPVSMNGYLYRVNVIGAAPCGTVTSLQRLLTVNPLPVVTITAVPTTRLMPGMTTTLTSASAPAAAIYQWMRNGVQVGGNTPTHVVDIDALGTYMLHVIDVNGCENNSNSILISDSASGTVFIYPNPNPGSFQVRYYSTLNNSGLPRALNIYDDKGARVYRQNYTINAPYGRMDVDMRKFGSGTYWVEVVDAEGNRLAVGRAMILR